MTDMSEINIIKWENRITDENVNHVCRVSVDGTDCRIREPSMFDTKWFSHKFKGPGLRYEIAVAIHGGIVWINGPYPCGSWPDLRIARDGIIHLLDEGEMLIADGGYGGDPHIFTPTGLNDGWSRCMSMIRARHETLNGKLKNFNVLNQPFRHDLDKHQSCFLAVANLVEITIKAESPLFENNFI